VDLFCVCVCCGFLLCFGVCDDLWICYVFVFLWICLVFFCAVFNGFLVFLLCFGVCDGLWIFSVIVFVVDEFRVFFCAAFNGDIV